jgi:hypothetical protein
MPVQHETAAYRWQNVAIGGGGYVTGIAVHPSEPDLVYVRTDIGGALRWRLAGGWQQLLDHFGPNDDNLYGVESIALDPGDPDVIYAAVGKYRNAVAEPGSTLPLHDILKSTDRGESWVHTGIPVAMGANEYWRWAGERLAVDPNDGRVIYFGSRDQGLWCSTSAAEPGSWQQLAFPTTGEGGAGLLFVLFDPRSGGAGRPSQSIYVGVRGAGVYRTEDGGARWALLEGSPRDLFRAALGSDGTLFISHDTGVARFANGDWQEIAPERARFCALAVDANDPQHLLAVRLEHTFNNTIYRSLDGGATWRPIQAEYQSDVPWWPRAFWAAAVSAIAIDPQRHGRVWYTDWFGTWRTDDIAATPSEWVTSESGHEELVVFALLSPPVGPLLFSGVADVSGFCHKDLTIFPDRQNTLFQDATSIDLAAQQPSTLAIVGGHRDRDGSGAGQISFDGGESWQDFASLPTGARNGRIALSADGSSIVWLPESLMPFVSTDGGASWTPSASAPAGAQIDNVWRWQQPLAADRNEAQRFYLFDRSSGLLYRSDDGGLNWRPGAQLAQTDHESVRSAPGLPGEVWVSLNHGGLWRSSDGGQTAHKLAEVERARMFDFGAPAPGSAQPSVFVYGVVTGVDGVFRSDDLGISWQQINSTGASVGNAPNAIAGDRQVFGRVYIGTNGHGILYGEQKATTP